MRLVGQAKAGFFPTPVNVVQSIIKSIKVIGNVKILDTCCGEGVALGEFKKAFPKVATYGTELDSNRYEVAKYHVDNVLNCDSLSEFEATNNAFDILFLNPPYDWDIRNDDEKSVRLERRFLLNHMRYLKGDGGLLIYIVPIYSLKYVINTLVKLVDLQILPLPETDYEIYKQVVVIGKSVNFVDPKTTKPNKELLENIINNVPERSAYNFLPTVEESKFLYEVTPTQIPLKTFHTRRINPDDVMQMIKISPVEKAFQNNLKGKSINHINPLSELTEGHLAMLIASGLMDGELVQDGEHLIVKGFVRETWTESEEVELDKRKYIRKKGYKITINTINLSTDEFIRVEA